MEISFPAHKFQENYDQLDPSRVLELTVGHHSFKLTTINPRKFDIYLNLLWKFFSEGYVRVLLIPDDNIHPLSNIICTSIRPKLSCTTLGEKISSALIRVASSRIFSIPKQSFLELPVNSIDSYNW